MNRAVVTALKWLASHQSENGRWDSYQYQKMCPDRLKSCRRIIEKGEGYDDVGITGLALLAFLGAGHTHLSSQKVTFHGETYNFGKVVKNGLSWLKNQQNEDGAFASGGRKPMYSHAIATLAYAEAYGLTGARPLRKYARKGLDYLENAQNQDGGWRYVSGSRKSDTSVTGWAVMAIQSARLAGMEVPEGVLKKANSFVCSVTDKSTYKTGYKSVKDIDKKVRVTGKNENYRNHPAMTSIGMITRIYTGEDPDVQALRKGLNHLMEDLPKWQEGAERNGRGNSIDYYYWYYGTLAVHLYAGLDSPNKNHMDKWEKWAHSVKKALLDHSNTANQGHQEGSWDPLGRWSYAGGRVYATALNALTLEVYYRYRNVFTGNR